MSIRINLKIKIKLYIKQPIYVSNLGRIAKLKDNILYLLPCRNDTKGYKRISLSKSIFNSSTYQIHRLVAFLFIYNDKIEELELINHKKMNLKQVITEFQILNGVIIKKNVNYGTRNKRSSQKIKESTHSESNQQKYLKNRRPIQCKCIIDNTIVIYDSLKEASEKTLISMSKIIKLCRDQASSFKNYSFEYVDKIVQDIKHRDRFNEPIIQLDFDYNFIASDRKSVV